MKQLIIILFVHVFCFCGWAKKPPVIQVQDSRTWDELEVSMEKLRREDELRGWSYVISGAIVTTGGLIAAKNTEDPALKFVYGITGSAGIAAIAYGFASLSFGNNYNSFYDSLKETNLSQVQRNALVHNFMENEKERREKIQRLQMIAHFCAGALNIYSASVEKDPNAKTFYSALAGINLAFAISYAF